MYIPINKLQECPKFHNDAHLSHGFAHLLKRKINTFFFFSYSTTAFRGRIFAEVIVYCSYTVY
jgi:hypothetical protein